MDNKTDSFFFGIHFMVDGYDAPELSLCDRDALRMSLLDIPQKMEMHTISEPVVVEVGPNNKKDPGGVSGMVLIAESHFSFHTFPKRGFVTIDVYTCKDKLDTDGLLESLRDVFKFKNEETHLVKRGRNYPNADIQ